MVFVGVYGHDRHVSYEFLRKIIIELYEFYNWA
jgi:hypothetical protein